MKAGKKNDSDYNGSPSGGAVRWFEEKIAPHRGLPNLSKQVKCPP